MEGRDEHLRPAIRSEPALGKPGDERLPRERREYAFVHLAKALGKIASAVNDAEHAKRKPTSEEVSKYLADLVICAARFADGIQLSLDAAVAARLAEKFPNARF